MDQRSTIPELLSPAGDWEALRAAVANGADSVYFGLPQFNARHRATNFAPDELPDIMRYLHQRNVKGFVALNTLIFSNELPAVVEYVKAIAQAGADAVIVQDLGLVRLIKKLVPTLAIHASTQMTLTEARGIGFARKLGVDLVVLARELTLDEIRKVTASTRTPVEVFVHGALCVAYSGQCLTSEALGGRSANRGQCAQACRLPYEMIVDGQKRELGDRAYLLSPQDLAAHHLIADLVSAGVASFKIEGRLKSASYVAATTQTYRAAIDAAVANRDFELTQKEQRDLAQTFSRGFIPGFLEGVNHQQLVQGRVPKSRGVCIGSVVGFSKQGVKVGLRERDVVEEIIKPGDGVVFDLGTPEGNEPGGRVWKVQSPSSTRRNLTPDEESVVELSFQPGAMDFSSVPVGCNVWKTDDPALRKRLEQSFAHDRPCRRVPISIEVSGRVGTPLRIAVTDDAGRQVTVEWTGPLAAARKHPLTREMLREQFGRLGDTPFLLDAIELAIDEPVMAPVSVLNNLRRQLIDQLKKIRDVRQEITNPSALEHLRERISNRSTNEQVNSSRLSVLVRTLEQLDAVLGWNGESALPGLETVYCDFEDTRRYREAVLRARNAGVRVGLSTLRIIKPGEEGFLRPIVSAEPDAVLARNLASLDYFRETLPNAALIGDFSLNVANEITADLLIREGFSRLTPSFDLNWDQLAAMVERADPGWFEPVIHQHMPMFHMEHCVFAAFLSSGKDFRDCGRPCDHHQVDLRDRVGARFPVAPDVGCRNTVFNATPQSAAEYILRMQALGLRHFRVELLRETPGQVVRLLEQYDRILAGKDDGRDTWRQLQAVNQLGVTRGTMQLI